MPFHTDDHSMVQAQIYDLIFPHLIDALSQSGKSNIGSYSSVPRPAPIRKLLMFTGPVWLLLTHCFCKEWKATAWYENSGPELCMWSSPLFSVRLAGFISATQMVLSWYVKNSRDSTIIHVHCADDVEKMIEENFAKYFNFLIIWRDIWFLISTQKILEF